MLKIGLMQDFRNPREWHRPNPELYRAILDQIVRAEEFPRQLDFESLGKVCEAMGAPLMLAENVRRRYAEGRKEEKQLLRRLVRPLHDDAINDAIAA